MRARRLSLNAHVLTLIAAGALSRVIWLAIPSILTLLGATGRAHALAADYLAILVPALPPLAVAMTSASVLRSIGDARRAMNVTLIGAVINTLLDVILILGSASDSWGGDRHRARAPHHDGCRALRRHHRARSLGAAATAHASSRCPRLDCRRHSRSAHQYRHAHRQRLRHAGDGSVRRRRGGGLGGARQADAGRLRRHLRAPGTVGPIIGQNYGARAFDRVRATFTQSLWVTAAFTGIAWVLLAVLARPIAGAFEARGEPAELIVFYCRFLAPLFIFLGALFVANAVFNTLGRPHTSALLNWGRATLGTIPFVTMGAYLAGAPGVLAGSMSGGLVFGVLAVWLAYRWINELAAVSVREATQARASPTTKP